MNSKKVLYIDADEDQRRKISSQLNKRDFEVTAVPDGKTGLSAFLENRPLDIILCYLNLTEMNALDLLDQTKEYAPDTPFIILADSDRTAQAVELLEKGASALLTPPFDISVLEITIRKAIDNIRLLHEAKIAQTVSQSDINEELNKKAVELEERTIELAKANVELLGVQEQLEEKNSKLEQLLNRLSHSRDELQAILESFNAAIIMVNRDNIVTATNKRLTEMFGIPVEDAKDKPLARLHHRIRSCYADPDFHDKLADKLKATPDPPDKEEFRISLAHSRAARLISPKAIDVYVYCVPVLDQNDDELGRVWVYVNITHLLRADEQLNFIVEASPVPTIISRIEDGKIIFANEHLGRLVGLGKDELLGHSTLDFYYDLNERQAVLEQLGQNGYIRDHEIQLKQKDGNPVWVTLSLIMTQLRGERVVVGGLYDITERKKAEEALKQERNFVSAVLDTAGALIVVVDLEGRIARFNRAFELISGYTFDEIKDKPFWDIFVTPDKKEKLQNRFTEIIDKKIPYSGEDQWRTKEGMFRTITWSNTVLTNDNGEAQYVVSIGIDITERREAEEKLRLYREIYLNSLDGIVIFDSQGNYIESNPTQLRRTGYAVEEIRSKGIDSIIGPVAGKEIFNRLMKGDTFRGEIDAYTKKGETVAVDISAFPIKDEEGVNTCFVGIGRDVTEQKHAREALRTHARYEEGLADCLQALLNINEVKPAINEALQHLLEASNSSRVYIYEAFEDPTDGLCVRHTFEAFAPGITSQKDIPYLQHLPVKDGFDRWRDVLTQNEPIKGVVENFPEGEQELLRSQGVQSILALPITVEGEWFGFIGFDDCKSKREWTENDIRILRTASEIIGSYLDRKRFEEALRVSEERFRTLVENATDMIYSLTPDGKFSYLSPQFTQATGFDVEDYIGKSSSILGHPDEIEQHDAWVEEGMPCDKGPYGFEFRMKTKDENWRWFTSNSSTIKDEDGNIIEAIGVAHDITNIKQVMKDLEEANNELRETQAQLVQSEKMASLGQLVAGIAHEINTPIGAASSMHNTLVRAIDKLRAVLESDFPDECAKNKSVKSYLKVIEDANKVIDTGTERVITIVRRLRSFARLDEAELKTVDIHEGLEDTLTLIHHEIKHHINLKREYGDIPSIACYPGRLNQVFLNILNNARHAVGEKGEITIRTYQKDYKVHIAISDDGIGISQEHLDRIFDPGFTTKGVGVGTGLGLSICFQIIQDHQGTIEVTSEPGKGTTFAIILPMNLDQDG
jgi:PAS domain S-box-containing protein